MSPECSPTDIFNDSRPTDVGTAAAWRSAVRISTAASHACSVWSGAREEEQQRVAAELEQLTAARPGDPQHRAEDAVEGLDDLLGTDPAAP